MRPIAARISVGSHVLCVSLVIAVICAALASPAGARSPDATAAEGVTAFRYSVAFDGDVAVVGADWHDGFAGAAYVLRRQGDRWMLEQKLVPGDSGRYDHFGSSVAISGDVIVVGAPWHDMLRGSAYVFRLEDGSWMQQQKLTASDARLEGLFGSDLRTEGDEIVVASGSEDAHGTQTAYLFALSGDRWVERGRTTAPLAAENVRLADRASLDDVLIGLRDSGLPGADLDPPAMPAAPPDPVDTVKVTNGTLEDRVEIRWASTGLDAIVYKIMRDGALLSIAASNDSLYRDTTGDINTTYSYCVVVKNMLNEESTWVCADGLRILYTPTTVRATDGLFTDGTTLSWVDISKIEEGYYVYRDGERIDSTGAGGAWISDTTGTPGTIYTYEVRAYAEGEESAGAADTGWRGLVLPPLDVSATDGEYIDQVAITWTDQAGDELGYRIYRDDVLIDSTGVDGESFVDSTVAPGTGYEYCVATIGSGFVESVHACDDGGTVLTAPGSVSASDSTYDNRIRLTWDDLTQVEDGFEISRALGPDTVVLDTTRANTQVYDDYSPLPDITYTYIVRAVTDLGGVSAPGSDEGFMSVVLAPVNVEATDGAFEDHVDITWETTSTKTVLFKIYRGAEFIKSLSVGNSTYSDYGGTANEVYDYTVVAATALEAEAAGTPDAGSRELGVPTAVEATDEEHEDRIVVSWNDNSSLEHGYTVTRRDNSASEDETTFVLGPNRTTMTDYNAVPGVTYRYIVAAFDSVNGEIGYSGEAEDLGLRVLLAPTQVRAGDAEYEEKVEIFWKDNSTAEDGYHIYRDDVLIGETEDNFTSFVDTSPELGAVHTYSVAAYDSVYPSAAGESERDDDTGSTTILAPVSFNASDIYEDRIELAWVDVSSVESGFLILRDEGPSTDPDTLALTGPDVTAYTDDTPQQNVSYRYCILAFREPLLVSEESCDYGSAPAAPEIETVTIDSRLIRDDPAAADRYGIAVGVTRGAAIIGSYWDNDAGTDAGSAYIFERNEDGGWSQRAELTASNAAAGDNFGTSVAIDGKRALVGAPSAIASMGCVYQFLKGEDGVWAESDEGILFSLDALPLLAQFGSSLAMMGDLAVITAPGWNSATGAAYVFSWADSTWTQEIKLIASDGVPGDRFGASVAIDGGTVLVGSAATDTTLGSVYVFERISEGNWTEKCILTASDETSGDQFGYSLAIYGDVALVGALQHDSDRGAAYVFHRQLDGSWIESQRLAASDGMLGDYFGCSIGLREGVALISAVRAGVGTKAAAGAVYVFERDPAGGWTETQKITSDRPHSWQYLGRRLAFGADAAVIGAYGESWDAWFAGAAYVIDSPSPPADVAASDGSYDGKIRVTWDDISSLEEGYYIYRDGKRVLSVNANVEVFEDYDAEPGRTYEYGVEASAGGIKSIFNPQRESDFGWRPPNGNITGRISARAGGASEGIYVGLDPLPTKALLFDGGGGYVHAADTQGDCAFGIDDDFTVEAWLRYTDTGGTGGQDGTLIAKVSLRDGDDKKYPFWLSNLRTEGYPGRLVFSMSDGEKTAGVSSVSDGLNDNAWHHVACVHDAADNELQIYIDGNLEGVTPYTGFGDIANSDSLSFGAGATSGSWYGGQLDEIRIWDVARDSTQIRESMYSQLSGEETGLIAYWPLDEGSSGVITDPYSAEHYGVFSGGVYWTENSAPLHIYAQTGESGTYVLDDLQYGSETTFRVRPFEGNRQFDPPFSLITLSIDQPVQNQVNFSDISSYTISGIVVFKDTECPASNVPIYVDNTMGGSTDKNGKFAVAVDNGWHSIKPFLAGRTFEPDSIEVEALDDVVLPPFSDQTTRVLSGTVGGGCGRRIGDVVITVQSDNGCMSRSITADSAYSITLPPQMYLVSAAVIESSIPEGLIKSDVIKYFQNLGQREAVLDSFDTVMDMTYRAPLTVDIEGFEAYVHKDCGGSLTFENRTLPDSLPVVPQLEILYLEINVKEDYGSEDCPLDSGMVVIYDEISDREGTPIELEVLDGVARYTTFACTPSLIVGRTDSEGNDRSFQKAIRAVAFVEGRTPVTGEEWVVVTGHIAPPGADFVTGTLQMPVCILRDPPGDRSYAYIEEGTTLRKTIDWDKFIAGGQIGPRIKLWWGLDQKFFFGLGAGTIEGIIAKNKFETELLVGYYRQEEKKTEITYTTKRRISTSDHDLFVGGDADVFMGYGTNFIFSEVAIVQVHDCEILRSDSLGVQMDGIETHFVYTGQYIRDVLIPELQAKVDYYDEHDPDGPWDFEEYRDWWIDILEENEHLKYDASLTNEGNRSFSGGTEYSFICDTTTTKSCVKTNVFQIDWQGTLSVGALQFSYKTYGINIAIMGKSHDEILLPGYTDTTGTVSNEIGYVLCDDNIGDHFTVDVKKDDQYPTRVFDVLAGASSCPYEAWPDSTGEPRVVSRDKPVLNISEPGIYDLPPDELATFTLSLSNQSPTDEARRYVLREIASSNPNGAMIRANGVFINDDLVYYPDPGQTLNLTITVERGPTYYSYNGLKLMVYPLCEWWIFEDGGPLNLADTVTFDVTFQRPCSDITLFRPESGWLINQTDTGIDLTLKDYVLDVDGKVLQAVGCEYRSKGAGDVGPTAWDTMFVALPDEEILQTYYSWQPDVSLPDGVYELRAFTSCAGGSSYSDVATGTIDRHAPVVFGTPEPSDEDLSFGEDIAITFNEPVACESIPDSCVVLKWLDGPNEGSEVALETVCNGTTIVIIPTADTELLEGRRLEASVSGIRDIAGNVMQGTATWTFEYRKNRFAWSDGDPEFEVPYRNPGMVTAELVNGTGQPIDFTILQPPAWIESVTPSTGSLGAGEKESITFDMLETLEIGTYADSIFAEGVSGGDTSLAGMFLTLDVSCMPPLWTVRPGDYEYTMTMVAEVDIGGSPSDDTNDMLSAWVGSQLRGVAYIQNVTGLPSSHLAFITIYGNRTQGETVRFQVWDDDDCYLWNATLESYPFVANDQIGSPQSPITLTATDTPQGGDGLLVIDLDAGWNWISTNILSPDMSVDGVTADLLPAPGDIVKSQTDFTQFVSDSTGWVPTMVIDNVSSYMLRLTDAGTIYHSGTTVSVDSVIPVGQGWNWIGYLPDGPIEVTEALSDLDVKEIVGTDDIIKSQDGFAQFYGSQWYGSLDSMRAGEGYKLFLSGAGEHTFNYPEYVAAAPPPLLLAPGTDDGRPVEGAPDWSVNPRDYQFNMTMTAVVRIEDSESADEDDIIAAFAGGECRGVANPVYIESMRRHISFLMIYSNEAEGEEVTFRAFDADAALVYEIDESIDCRADAVEGTVTDPLVLHAGAVQEEESEIPSAFGLAQNFPNPFNPMTVIAYDVPSGGGSVTIRIYDVGGRLIRTLIDRHETAGRKSVAWHGLDDRGGRVATGVYFYRMKAPGFEKTRKMVLLK